MAARSVLRIVIRTVVATVLLLLLVAGGGLYWLGTPQALDWLARQAVAVSEGRLMLEGVEGSLRDRVTIRRAVFKDKSLTLDARAVVFEWRPLMLLKREAQITRLAIDDLRVTSADGSAEPPQLPSTLRLPLNVALADARIRRIELAPDRVVHDLHLRLRTGSASHELELVNVSVMGVGATGTLRLDTTTPYAATGKLDLAGTAFGESIKAAIAVGGKLDALQLQATMSARGTSAGATALVQPFSPLLLGKLTIDAENLDLANWDSSLPRTEIGISLQAGMPAPDRFTGTLRARNLAPGPIDAQRVPVTAATLAFAGDGTRWQFSEIDIAIGKAGHARGSGLIEAAGTQLALVLTDIATAELHSKLKPIMVSGQATIAGDVDAQRVAVSLQSPDARLNVEARHAQQVITIERGELRAADGRLDFTGHAALTAKREFLVNAKFSGLDPARFIDAPSAQLNGTLSATGLFDPQWQAQIQLAIANSRFRGQPLTASAGFTTSAAQLFAGEARATLAGNRIDVSGRFGEPGDKLKWTLAAANLKAIDGTLAGNVQAEGTFAGRIDQAAVDFKLTARGFSAGTVVTNTIDAQGTLNGGTDSDLRLNARITGIKTASARFDELQLNAQGSRLRHDITAALRGAKFDASLKAAGGVDEQWRWNGNLTTLDARGSLPFRLTAPARVSVGRNLLTVEGLQAAALDGKVGPLSLHAADGNIATRGSFAGITAKALLALAPKSGIDGRDLTIGGRWDFALGETVTGSAAFYREAGDLGMRTERGLPFGLNQVKLNVTAQGNTVDAVFDAQSTRMGTLAARAMTRLERRDGAWVLSRDAPVEGEVNMDMQSLGWLRALTPQLDQVGGRMAARLAIAGTLSKPLVTGHISADDVEVRAIAPGLHFSNGTLRADFEGSSLKISKLYLQAGDGKIEADGIADISNGLRSVDINARADHARILDSPELTVVLSGAGHAGLRDFQLALDGKFKIDSGRYDIGIERKPELGDDVIIAGREPVAAKPMKVVLDLTVDLNNNFSVRGHGLDAVVGGSVQIATRGDALRALGTIRTVSGEYFAFGQRLDIERGELSFSGPLSNPGLNLRASRKIRAVEVGVEVRGSLQRPTVSLVSDPVMSDSDRLGWLVLGRDPQTASAAELAILQAAALSSGTRRTTPVQKRIAGKLGLDEFGVSQGGEGALGVVALGKRITDKLTVRLEQGLGGTAGGLLKIDYLLSERWRLQGTAGAESAADILFTLRFD